MFNYKFISIRLLNYFMSEGEKMLLIEVLVPQYVHNRIVALSKQTYKDVVKEVTRSRTSGVTRVFIEDCPKGWWVALKILREGSGKLYLLREVKYMDIPSKVMELSMKRRWRPEYGEEIEEELRRWGLKHE